MDVINIPQQQAAMPKEAIRYITQNISPEEVQYVSDVKFAFDDYKNKAKECCKCKDCECEAGECKCYDAEQIAEDAVYVTKIMAFADKFRVLHWAAVNMSYHKAIDDFCDIVEGYKDAIAENVQSIIGQFTGKEFHLLTLPISDNPLDIINELKMCVANFLEKHREDIEYEGCVNATSGFLEEIHKYIYLFRLCKD